MRFTPTTICNWFIEYSFYALFALAPIVFTSSTSELFEFNKMWLTFGFTIIIGAAWICKMILQKRILFQRTPLDIPLALFLLSQIISTFVSLDTHVSIWGYYSRFNGGLLSTITYIFLYYAFVSNVFYSKTHIPTPPLPAKKKAPQNKSQQQKLELLAATDIINKSMVKRSILVTFMAGLFVTLWGLPSHFGYDPTCFVFRGTFDVSCWTDAFQPKVRIFSTLGQPNWLAAYISIVMLFAFGYGLSLLTKTHYGIRATLKPFMLPTVIVLLTLYYFALLFTDSISGFAGFGLALLFFFFGIVFITKLNRTLPLIVVAGILLLFVFFTGIFGQSIVKRMNSTVSEATGRIFHRSAPQATPPQNTATKITPPENQTGGTESWKIRFLYVWPGAIEVFKHYPLFGSGVETFAFSYYQHRPVGHNLASEWDYLYNKAHNEYLNYLATTGIVGLTTYCLFLFWFLFLASKELFFTHYEDKSIQLLGLGLVGAFLTILISNFFGFSVVITNLYLFLIPAFFLSLFGNTTPPPLEHKTTHSIAQWIGSSITILGACIFLFMLLQYWEADKAYSLGSNESRSGDYAQAQADLKYAVALRPDEPTFRDELAVNSAIIAAAYTTRKDTENAKKYATSAVELSDAVTNAHPNNIVFWKSKVRLYYYLSELDPTFLTAALAAMKKAKSLAPTDAKVSYSLGVLYGQNGQLDKGIVTLKETAKLKPDYRDAYYALALFYHEKAVDDKDVVKDATAQKKAITTLQYVLDHFGKDTKMQETLEKWQAQ